ncbi:MAG: methyltransferase domain-containing protein [Thermoleophilia bacterium]
MKEKQITSAPGGSGAFYDVAMWPAERLAIGGWRQRLAKAARGRVLEIGAGTGAQLRWFAPGTEVVALEPNGQMAARARRRAVGAAARVTVVEAVAEELPFADDSFDSVVGMFTLCSVADPERVLAEVDRVLAPDGVLLLLEHVHLPWQPGRLLQSLAAPAWARLAGGCRLDRDTEGFLRQAGFKVLERRTHVADWVIDVVAVRS